MTHLDAKIIASAWHSGQDSALYALSSSGAILDGILPELNAIISFVRTSDCYTREDMVGLMQLRAYVRKHGKRAPIATWYLLTW